MKSFSSSSQKGSALIMALVASFILSISAVIAQQFALTTQKNMQFVRMKNMLLQRENLARSLLASPAMYNCDSNDGYIDISLCQPKEEELKSLVNFPVEGCELAEDFPPGTICGFRIKNDQINVDVANKTVELSIEYTGSDFALKSLSSEVRFKIETLAGTGDELGCPENRPLLKGLNADGSLNCASLAEPSLRSCLGAGRYIEGIGDNFATTCGQVTRTDLRCSNPNQFILRMGWSGRDQFSVDCGDKLDPWSVAL